MPSISKQNLKRVPLIKQVALILLILAVIIGGFLIGSYISSMSTERVYRGTFVLNRPISLFVGT